MTTYKSLQSSCKRTYKELGLTTQHEYTNSGPDCHRGKGARHFSYNSFLVIRLVWIDELAKESNLWRMPGSSARAQPCPKYRDNSRCKRPLLALHRRSMSANCEWPDFFKGKKITTQKQNTVTPACQSTSRQLLLCRVVQISGGCEAISEYEGRLLTLSAAVCYVQSTRHQRRSQRITVVPSLYIERSAYLPSAIRSRQSHNSHQASLVTSSSHPIGSWQSIIHIGILNTSSYCEAPIVYWQSSKR